MKYKNGTTLKVIIPEESEFHNDFFRSVNIITVYKSKYWLSYGIYEQDKDVGWNETYIDDPKYFEFINKRSLRL